jgi:hypothetical protein
MQQYHLYTSTSYGFTYVGGLSVDQKPCEIMGLAFWKEGVCQSSLRQHSTSFDFFFFCKETRKDEAISSDICAVDKSIR